MTSEQKEDIEVNGVNANMDPEHFDEMMDEVTK